MYNIVFIVIIGQLVLILFC